MSNSPAEYTTIRHLLRRHIEYPYGEQKATLRIILIAIFPLIKSHWSPKGQWLWPIQWIPNINLSNRFIPPQINCTSISILPFNSDRAFSSNYKIKYLRRCVCLCALRMNEIKVMKQKKNKQTNTHMRLAAAAARWSAHCTEPDRTRCPVQWIRFTSYKLRRYYIHIHTQPQRDVVDIIFLQYFNTIIISFCIQMNSYLPSTNKHTHNNNSKYRMRLCIEPTEPTEHA